MEYVDTFAALFRGRTDAYGTNAGSVHRVDSDRPLTWASRYAAHLRGDAAIGIFPMLDDNTVWFGAIDLDEPNFDLARQMQGWIPAPSWLERSRSGNAHVWVFFKSPAPAWAVRAILRAATEVFDRRDVEVFPKQDALREGMVGNYINLPYFGEERPFLMWPTEDGPPVPESSREAALASAYHQRHDPAVWVQRARLLGARPPEEREAASEWGTSPTLHECASYIIEGREERPLRKGARHVVLFNLAKMLVNWREMTHPEALHWLREVNQAAEAPIPELELERTLENAINGRFTSTGCDEPLMADYVSPSCPILAKHG